MAPAPSTHPSPSNPLYASFDVLSPHKPHLVPIFGEGVIIPEINNWNQIATSLNLNNLKSFDLEALACFVPLFDLTMFEIYDF